MAVFRAALLFVASSLIITSDAALATDVPTTEAAKPDSDNSDNTQADDAKPTDSTPPVSYYEQVRPILQARCNGCHQPAKPSAEYVMTAFDRLLEGGESGLAAIVPREPDESYLVEQITPVGGTAAMPRGKKPLSDAERQLIRTWIEQGARDDTPENARQVYNADNPPLYTRPPVITSLDYSPDGTLLAVAGFHEVLLVTADGSELVGRLIGLAERIESVRFSPDGKRLCVTGGLPGRMGEVQLWDVATGTLQLSVPVTYDTVYGGSWSPDGKLVAFGCADNTVRAINAQTGDQVLYQGAHNDWVRDTVFTNDGAHLVSVGRDMTVKLTEVATERFIDNVTSITPGALKGGVNSVVRHPRRNELVVGGADGVPKVYRVFRITARKIGDDANLIRRLTPMTGRCFCVDVSDDGKRIAAVSALDGRGELAVYSYEFDTSLSEEIRKISEKKVRLRSADEKKKLADYRTRNVTRIAGIQVPATALYAVAFAPDGKLVATAGGDGIVRVMAADSGKITSEFAPAPVTEASDVAQTVEKTAPVQQLEPPAGEETSLEDVVVEGISVEPETITLVGEFEYSQLIVTGRLSNGQQVDITRLATFRLSAPVADVSSSALVTPRAVGRAVLTVSLAEETVDVPISVSESPGTFSADFVRDVSPVLSRLGCNQGTCHGSAKGKNGFKLSLRGYDPLLDVRALADDLAARRTNVASPDDSLMLMKATGAVPHVGDQLIRPGEPYYRIIRNWIAGGAGLDWSTPRVAGIDVLPQNPVIQNVKGRQQMRVVATYTDGHRRDVTREAFIESGNTDIALGRRSGLMTAVRRGEAPVLARFEGAYAATTLTVMGDRTGFVWRQPETWGPIDELTAAKWERMKIQPSRLCSDAEFIRRVSLDLTGLPPTSEDVRAFLADNRETRVKRDELIDRLIGSEDYIEFRTNKWADLLQVNRKFLGPEGAAAFRTWIRSRVADNSPYDRFVREIVAADGSNKDNPAASYYKILRTPDAIMENTTHLFLAVRFNCNKCHDHPFERWTQDQYYQTAAYFARVGLKADEANSGDRRIGGTAVEGAKPFYEIVFEKDDGEVTHDRTGQITAPEFPYDCRFDVPGDASRRQRLAAWITSSDNQYFARSYVNRLWGYLFGIGIMEPIDDIRAGNPPTNPELLDYLTREFIDSGFNVRHVVRLICSSRTYQLSIVSNKWNEDDALNYSHATARRLPAEVLYDAIHRVVGAKTRIPGVPEGTRAAAIPDSGIRLTDGFLANLGRPPRESACECERINDVQLGPVMALISGPTVGSAIADPENELAKLVAAEANDARLVNELFLRIVNRPATAYEIAAVIDSLNSIEADHQSLTSALQEREAWWKDEKPARERAREQAVAAAKADLAAWQTEIAPRIAEIEKDRQQRIAAAEGKVREYESELAAHIADWESKSNSQVEWHLLEPQSLTSSGKMTLERLPDRSIRAAGDEQKGTYTVSARTALTGITGFRLEAMPDPAIEGGGPGLSDHGSFVVTEFEVHAASASRPDELTTVALHNASADFNQAGFSVAQAIDGKPDDQLGWSVSPAGAVEHWATFEAKKALGFTDGTVLRFTIHQNHDAEKHLLGRFRISMTTAKAPIGLSLPETFKSIVQTPAGQRSDAQTSLLTDWFRKTEPESVKRNSALADARKPLPEDPGLTRRKDTIAFLSRPVADDARLLQLRSDLEFSTRQLANKRLTAAQDVAWALINNPAFLFNR